MIVSRTETIPGRNLLRCSNAINPRSCKRRTYFFNVFRLTPRFTLTVMRFGGTSFNDMRRNRYARIANSLAHSPCEKISFGRGKYRVSGFVRREYSGIMTRLRYAHSPNL